MRIAPDTASLKDRQRDDHRAALAVLVLPRPAQLPRCCPPFPFGTLRDRAIIRTRAREAGITIARLPIAVPPSPDFLCELGHRVDGVLPKWG